MRYFLSILLFLSVTANCQNLNYSNISNQVLNIPAGNYKSVTFSNVQHVTFICNAKTVFGSVSIGNINDVTIDGQNYLSWTGSFTGFGTIKNWRLYNASTINNTNKSIDLSKSGGTNIAIANIHLAHSSQLIYTGEGDVVDSIDIHGLKVDSSLFDDKIVEGNFYRCNFYQWKVKNDPVFPFVDCGLIFITGNGSFHEIYQNGGWADLVRCFAASLDGTKPSVWVYNCIRLNTIKYGLADIEGYADIHVVNNTEGNCTDYEGPGTPNPGTWYTPIYIYSNAGADSRTTFEVRNNVGFNNQNYNNGIVNFTSQIISASNNNYYSTVSAAGFINDIDCELKPNSPLIDAGITIPFIKTDFSAITRPQGPAYDIGARESLKGSLAVMLTDFFVSPDPYGFLFRWVTQTESNNDHFEIEESNDGVNFHSIAKVNTQAFNGNSSIPLTYTYNLNL